MAIGWCLHRKLSLCLYFPAIVGCVDVLATSFPSFFFRWVEKSWNFKLKCPLHCMMTTEVFELHLLTWHILQHYLDPIQGSQQWRNLEISISNMFIGCYDPKSVPLCLKNDFFWGDLTDVLARFRLVSPRAQDWYNNSSPKRPWWKLSLTIFVWIECCLHSTILPELVSSCYFDKYTSKTAISFEMAKQIHVAVTSFDRKYPLFSSLAEYVLLNQWHRSHPMYGFF